MPTRYKQPTTTTNGYNVSEYINTFRLAGYFPHATTLPIEGTSTLFGILVQLTEGTVEHYKSDLYHDANTLRMASNDGTLKDGQVLAYGVRQHGTELHVDATKMIGRRSAVEVAESWNTHTYTIQLLKRDLGEWVAVVYRVHSSDID